MGSDQLPTDGVVLLCDVSIPQSGFYGFRPGDQAGLTIEQGGFQSLSRDSMGSDYEEMESIR